MKLNSITVRTKLVEVCSFYTVDHDWLLPGKVWVLGYTCLLADVFVFGSGGYKQHLRTNLQQVDLPIQVNLVNMTGESWLACLVNFVWITGR
jgi:hypothetical protein